MFDKQSFWWNQVNMHQIAIRMWDICFNTLRPRQNGRQFADATYKCIFLNENVWIPIKISLKFVPKGPINNNPALVKIMAWRRSGDKPLSDPMVVSLLTHMCVTRPQWVKLVLICTDSRWNIDFGIPRACYRLLLLNVLWIWKRFRPGTHDGYFIQWTIKDFWLLVS